MKTCCVFSTGVLVLAVSFLGCGSSHGYNANNVTVAVLPATATVAASGKVELQATVTGLCSGCMPEIDSWGITEDAGPGDSNGAVATGLPATDRQLRRVRAERLKKRAAA